MTKTRAHDAVTALIPANSRALVLHPGSVGSIDAYIQAVNRVPLLTPDEEVRLARQFRQDDDLEAAGRLVTSHLRLVVAVARNYLGYGLPHADLIQEGNIGLMKAVKRFDPERGVRLVSFALHWIKAEIHEFILRNWRLVKVATTKAQRKLFFNLRSMKQGLGTMSPDEIEGVARELNVKPAEVSEMETRLSGGDVALEGRIEDGEEEFAPIAYLADENSEPTEVLQRRQHDVAANRGRTRSHRKTWILAAAASSKRAGWMRMPTVGSERPLCMNWPTNSGSPRNESGRSRPKPCRRCVCRSRRMPESISMQ